MTKRKIKPIYQEPKIIRIKLDPEQAILQQCAVGGFYFNGSITTCMNFNTAGTGLNGRSTCPTSIKGVSTFSSASWRGSGDYTTQPS